MFLQGTVQARWRKETWWLCVRGGWQMTSTLSLTSQSNTRYATSSTHSQAHSNHCLEHAPIVLVFEHLFPLLTAILHHQISLNHGDDSSNASKEAFVFKKCSIANWCNYRNTLHVTPWWEPSPSSLAISSSPQDQTAVPLYTFHRLTPKVRP